MDQLDQLPISDFVKASQKVFFDDKGLIKIGGKVIEKELRDVLREQAKYLQTSQIWEVLEATIIQEASTMALLQSANMEHIYTAKMLYHWQFVFNTIIHKLSKE